MNRIVLVEDDRELGLQVDATLRGAGFSTLWLQKGQPMTAVSLIDVRLVILDLMLPQMSGMDMLRSIRRVSDVPVLVLSARNENEDKVAALAAGADDYMTKPFWPDELLARVNARLRRPVLERNDTVVFGRLKIDLTARRVRCDDEELDLTKTELAFLIAFARRPGAAVTRASLAELVVQAGSGREPSERALDSHVSRLRKKLNAVVEIETIWGVGYRLKDTG
jgi:DNA-binding response OmpR family regulator